MEHHNSPGPGPQEPARSQALDLCLELVRSLLWHNTLIARLLEEFEALRAEREEEDESRRAEHYQLNRRLDLVMGEFNDVFPDEVTARAFFHVRNPDRQFPEDVKRRRSATRRRKDSQVRWERHDV